MRNTERRTDNGNSLPPGMVMDLINRIEAGGGSPQDGARLIGEIRQQCPSFGPQIDTHLLQRITTMHEGLKSAQGVQEQLQEIMSRFTAPPLFGAIYLGPTELPAREPQGKPIPGAIVDAHGGRRYVALARQVDEKSLSIGDEVLLNSDQSAVVAKSSAPARNHGELAEVVRMLEGDRLLVRCNQEQRVVGIAGNLRQHAFQTGDNIRLDRAAGLAMEPLPATDGSQEFRLESVDDIALDRIGGLVQVRDEIISVLTLAISAPEIAKRYQLGGQRTILLKGPPGVGKTMLSRIAAAEVQRKLGKQCSLLVVKPGEFEDPYVGVTQQRIRQCFKALRSASGFGLLFLDEVESIGRARAAAGSVSFHNDRFLAALLAEIQGFESENPGGAPTALICATNQANLLDPALVERMQIQINVPRPDLRAARQIFEIHLPPQTPCAGAEQARGQMIERALSTLYGVNASALAIIRFRDNTQRTVYARELSSGRCIEQICRAARQSAARRVACGGEDGVRMADMEDALTTTIHSMATTLTRGNVHQYLGDVREDAGVVAVEPIVHRVARPHRFVREEPAAA